MPVQPRLGSCRGFVLDEPPGTHATLKAERAATPHLNLATVTMAHRAKLAPAARAQKPSGIVSHNPGALARQIDRTGYGRGWHPHGAHINIHAGAGEPGVAGSRATLPRASRVGRDRVTVQNDESVFGLDAVRDPAAHSDLTWDRAVDDLVARHRAWADFEIEAKAENRAAVQIAGHILAGAAGA